MNEEPFAISLGARCWALPHLPFRVIKSVQPALFKLYEETGAQGAASLSEGQIDRLAEAVWRAIVHVDSSLTYEEFLSLSFSVGDLLACLPAVASAAGLSSQTATAEASPSEGK